jgi:hypothetical protein
MQKRSGQRYLLLEIKESELFQQEGHGKMKKKYIKTEQFDRKFEDGESVVDHLDITKALKPGQEQKRVNVDFPVWMVQLLDKEARKLGVTRQSVIKFWLAERLKESIT